MEERIELLRQKLIEQLEKLEEGIAVKLDYSDELLERLIFKREGEYKVFALPNHILSKIDFSNISFDEFRIYRKNEKFSFEEFTGVNINPQTIYEKNLNHSILNGVNFIGPFDGCFIEGADFTGSTGALIDPMKLGRSYTIAYSYRKIPVIYARSCKFNGVKFIGLIKNQYIKGKVNVIGERIPLIINIEGSDFTGSEDAVICLNKTTPRFAYGREYAAPHFFNDSTIYQSLWECVLRDATIKGSYENVTINDANFSGAKGNLKINPQAVSERNMCGTIFNGVYFEGPFNGCLINGADFTGSHGAVINVDNYSLSDIEKTNFTNVKLLGNKKDSFISMGLICESESDYEDALTEEINNLLGKPHETELIKKKALEDAKIKLIELNKIKIKNQLKELVNLIQTQEKLGISENKLYGSIPITQEVFLKEVSGYFEIDEEFIDISLLRFFNLSMIDFTNVKVGGLDFRHTGARIDPQTVYDKDISYCTFDGGNVRFFDDYSGVKMWGANFEECGLDAPIIR